MRALWTMLASFSLVSLVVALHVYKPPRWLIRLVQRRYPDVLFHVPTSSKILALSIDDGPSVYTPEIARMLAIYGAKATFFLIGSNIAGHEALLQEVITSGHELANHAMHDEPSIALSNEDLTRQIQGVEGQISAMYPSTASSPLYPKFFRPGSGFFNDAVRRVVKSLDYRIVLGSIYPWDAQISWPWLNAWHILSSVRPGGIIVIHERAPTREMLRILLPQLKRQGWTLTTVTELLTHAHSE